MTAELFTDAMSLISDKYITEALNYHYYRKNHSVIRWLGRCVLAACLTAVLCFGTVMAVSVEARTAVLGWVKTQCDSFYEYVFAGDVAVSSEMEYELGWMPEGLELMIEENNGAQMLRLYTDEQGGFTQFSYIYDSKGVKLYIDTVGYEQIPVKVNGNEGIVSISPSKDESNGIEWTNSDGILFYISGFFDEETLVKMAESVVGKEKTTEIQQ